MEILYNEKLQCYVILENGRYIVGGFEKFDDAENFMEAAIRLANAGTVNKKWYEFWK